MIIWIKDFIIKTFEKYLPSLIYIICEFTSWTYVVYHEEDRKVNNNSVMIVIWWQFFLLWIMSVLIYNEWYNPLCSEEIISPYSHLYILIPSQIYPDDQVFANDLGVFLLVLSLTLQCLFRIFLPPPECQMFWVWK